MNHPPPAAVLALQPAVRPTAGMTHATLSELCTRPPGTPPSQCRGSLEYSGGGIDAAQAGEGDVGDTVTIDIFRCAYCRANVVVSIGAVGGWRLRNEYDRECPKGV